MPGKYKAAVPVKGSIEVDGRSAIGIGKIQQILTELACEIAEERKNESAFAKYTPRTYSRFAAHRILAAHLKPAHITESTAYYFEDDVRALKPYLHPERGTKKGRTYYPPQVKERAVQLYRDGLNFREIARVLNAEGIATNYQTVNNWIRKSREGDGSH